MIKGILDKKVVRFGCLLLASSFYYILTFGKIDIVPSEDDVHLFSSLHLSLPLTKFGNLGYYIFIFVSSQVSSNPLNTIFVSYFLLSILSFFSLCLLLMKHLESFVVAFVLATCFLFSDYQILLVPKLTYLNFIFTCLGLFLLDKKKNGFQNYLILAFCILLNTYVARPEFIWFLIPITVFMLFFYFKKSPKTPQLASLTAFFLLMGFLYWVGGGLYPSGYLKEIFIQHFFDNYQIWTGKHFDLADEFGQFNNIYGKVESDFQVFTANPFLLVKHIVFNFKSLTFSFLKVFKSAFYEVFVSFFSNNTKYFTVLLILLFGYIIDFKNSLITFKKSFFAPKPLLRYMLWLLAPGLTVVLIIYPREHFVLLLLPFVFLGLGHLLKSIQLRQNLFSKVSFSAILFSIFVGIILKYPLKTNHPNNVDFYNYLNKIKVENRLRILSNDNFGFQYFDQNFERVAWSPFSETILDKVKSESIDVISIYRLDLEVPAIREFVNRLHTQTGYVQINNFEAQKRYLWVKPELVSKFQ